MKTEFRVTAKTVKNRAFLNIDLFKFICFKNKNGIANFIKGATARIIPISKALYPISFSTFGKNITYTPTAAK